MTQAGNFVREDVLSSFIRLVAHTPELQAYTVAKLYQALRDDVSQESLTLAAVWMIGEYGDILLTTAPVSVPVDDGAVAELAEINGTSAPAQTQQPGEVVDLLEQVLTSPYANSIIRQYVIVAATKFSARLDEVMPGQPALTQQLERLVKQFSSSIELEIQQRAVEFDVILSTFDKTMAMGVMERMPPPEVRATVMGTGARSLNIELRCIKLIPGRSIGASCCRQHSCRQRLAA